VGLALVAALLLGGAPANASEELAGDAEEETPSATETGKPRTRWFAMPVCSFDTDDGFGYGARAELAFDATGYTPYKSAYVLQVFFANSGFQNHRFRYDRTGLGRDGRLRLTVHVAWRQWKNDGFWGIGNLTLRDPHAHRKRYRYSLFQPFLHVTMRARLGGLWRLFGSLNAKWSRVKTYDGSLLSEHRPFGTDGGPAAIFSAGILLDTREPEITPRRGVLAELSARVAAPLPEQEGIFGGPFASLRGYLSLGSRVVLAGRIMSEWLFGKIPFYEMVHWGGAMPVAGFGGDLTLRGISFGRWRAPGKAILNAELRVDVGSHSFFGRSMRWLVVPYADAGMVYGGEDTPGPTGGPPIHPAAGIGGRLVFDEAFVGRLDAGFGLDPFVGKDGETRRELTLGLYVVFEHTF
jgi:hypothetical protein